MFLVLPFEKKKKSKYSKSKTSRKYIYRYIFSINKEVELKNMHILIKNSVDICFYLINMTKLFISTVFF